MRTGWARSFAFSSFLLVVTPLSATDFIRGDANSDGIVSLADREATLGWLFRYGEPPCINALDANDNGDVDITDVAALTNLFLGGRDPLPAPFPEPGPDPTVNTGNYSSLMTCESYGGGTVLEDPAARLEIGSAIAEGGHDGTAYILIALSSGARLYALGGALRFPSGLVTGVRNTEASTLVEETAFYGRMDGDLLRFIVAGSRPDTGDVPPGPTRVVLEIPICLAKGTPAGDYEIAFESGELVEHDSSRSIRPSVAGGVLTVLDDVGVAESCEGPAPPPPPPFNVSYELVGGSAPPGGTASVTFRIRADAPVQGFAYSIDHDEGVIEYLSGGPVWRKPDGSDFSFAVYEFNNQDATPGNAGIDEGFAVGAVVIDFQRPIALPVDEDNEVLRFRYRVRPDALPGSSELRFIDGAKGTGQATPNFATANGGAEYTRDTAESFIFVGSFIGVSPEIITFLRADSNGDGKVDISDPQATLGSLFLGSKDVACLDAADANDDGTIDITDPIFTLHHLFLGGRQPPPPFPATGEDPSADAMGCLYRSS